MNEVSSVEGLEQLLANLQVNVTLANQQKVGPSWKRENYVHTFNRMYYIISGEGRIEVAGKTYFPKPGQLVVMPCHVRQSYSSINENRFHKYWCHFTSRIGSRDLFELYQFPVCVDVDDRADVQRLFDRLLEHKRLKRQTSILSIHAAMLELISLFVEYGQAQMKSIPMTTNKLKSVLQYIEQHLHEPMTIEQLSGLVHYHPNYFIRNFHSILGCSPIQYINRMRLEKARQLLGTSMDVGEVARRVGIEPHNFSAMFKKYTGFSPRAYRQMMKE